MKKTNNFIFTRALILVLCIVMVVGSLVYCFDNVGSNKDQGSINPPLCGY